MRLVTVSVLALSLSLSQCVVFESLGSVSTSVNSISNLLGSISDSLKSISSSLESSSGDDKKTSEIYFGEVRSLTAMAVRENMPSADYLAELSKTARLHGVVDWAGTPATVVAMGEGIRDAGVSAEQYNQLRQSLIDTGAVVTVAALDLGYHH